MDAVTRKGEELAVDDEVAALYDKAQAVVTQLRDRMTDEATGEKVGPKFTVSRAAELVGRTPSAIREAERARRLPERERTATGHRVRYSLAELNGMRSVFGTRPWRSADDPPVVLAVQNFKGGVGKSTLSVHLAQYLAIRGYRVCLIDCDSQASTTSMFGYVPDHDLDADETLYGCLHDDGDDRLRRRVRSTHFDGLSLVPANLQLYNSEYEIAAHIARNGAKGFAMIDQIASAVETIADDFDVVVLDPPPALGMISLGVLNAANAMIIPMPPSIVDFTSTATFLGMLDQTMKDLAVMRGRRPAYSFVRVVASKADETKSMHREILKMSEKLFGRSMIRSVLKDSAEIDNASFRLSSVYELSGPITSREVHNRCLRSLNAVMAEIEAEIVGVWPSRSDVPTVGPIA